MDGQSVAAAAEHGHAGAEGLDCLHLDPATRADAALRLKSVRGHVDGIIRMLEDPGVYCVDVLKQVSAVQGAVRKVSESVLRARSATTWSQPRNAATPTRSSTNSWRRSSTALSAGGHAQPAPR